MEPNHQKHRHRNHLHPIGGGGYAGNVSNTGSLAGINTLNSTPDAKSSSGFIQQINRLSEDEAIAQGYTVIKTAQDLDNIRNDLDGKYILMNDIDLSSYSNWDPIGEFDVDAGTVEGFTGVLDGNGYVISNLLFNNSGNVPGSGLFIAIGNAADMIYDGEVRNLGLENVDITGIAITGALAGHSAGTISNCYVTGEVTSYQPYYCGALVGQITGGTITDCFSTADVFAFDYCYYAGGLVGSLEEGSTMSNCYATGDVTGVYIAGGLIGALADNSNISNSYATGDVTGGAASNGGLSGFVGNVATISNCYATGNVAASSGGAGGLVGVSEHNCLVENSFWNTETTGQSVAVGDNQGGTESNNMGLTTAEMQDPANWQGWDTSIWDFSTYPPTFKMYTPTGGGSTGGGTDPDDPNTPGGGTGGAGDVPIPGAVRLQIGSDSSSTSAIYVDTSFDLGAFDVDFSSANSCAAAIEDIDEVLSRINTKRSEFGAVINRLSSILESQTTTLQNFTSAKSTILDADIANESADFVKNQILQQTSSALLAQSQNLHASIVLSLIG